MKNQTQRLRADTHVHFHACFEEASFLGAAADNLGVESGESDQVSGVICLTETETANWFERLKERMGEVPSSRIAGWSLQKTGEPQSVIAADDRGRKLAIIAGRQIVCEERLEVLALGFAGRFADGQPIRDVLRSVDGDGAIAVVPWGFGKWTGRRRAIVEDLLDSPPCRFFLGDNGGRPAGLPAPALFAEAASRGMAVLPGTDPFPFSWDARRVGTYGLEWDGGLDPDRPFLSLKSLLLDPAANADNFGGLQGMPGFIRNQAAIHLKSILSKWRR